MSHAMVIPYSRFGQNVDDEFIRLLGFTSEKIISIEKRQSDLVILMENDSVEEEILSKIERMMKHRKHVSEEKVIFSTNQRASYCTEFPESVVKNYGNGLIGLKGAALTLFEYFDHRFQSISGGLSAISTQYPALLPTSAMSKTGYLRTSPQYSMFVCHPKEDIDELAKLNREVEQGNVKAVVTEPLFVLSPAACFHCYMDQEHSELAEPTVFTFRQKVFRHEGNKNWGSFGRLRDYHVREFVFIGDDLMVRNQRNYVLEQVKQLVEELGLTARISVTSDPFVVPSMQKFKKIQVEEENKLELQLAYGPDNYLAVASFNLHGTTFTEPFDIRVKSTPHTVTGCVGFGLERWVLGFMAQHGIDPNEWNMITI